LRPSVYNNIAFEMLRDYLGSEREAFRFMRAFAGIFLKIPTMPMVERMAKDHQIAKSLNADPATSTVRRLADLYSLPPRAIAKSFFKSTGRGLKHIRLKQARMKRWGTLGTTGASIPV
jgi:hypothetical protein